MQDFIVLEQLKIMMFSLVFGCFFGLIYDLIRVVRKLIVYDGKSKICRAISRFVFVQLSDIVYFLLLAVSFCIFLFYFNSGRFRWYLLFSLLIGFFGYDLTIGKIMRKVLFQLVKVLRVVFRLFIILPLKKLVSLIAVMLSPVNAYIKFQSGLRFTKKEKARYIKELDV